MNRSKVHIVGAGFSGLTLAYYLKKNFPEVAVTVHEATNRVGGLLQTNLTEHGIAEAAANAILDSDSLRKLAADVELELQSANPKIRRAYFWRNKKLRAWPLTWLETAAFAPRVARFLANRQAAAPVGSETVEQWGARVWGAAFAAYVLDPVLGGIYATKASVLSARVVVARFFEPRVRTGARKKLSSVAPVLGMHEFARKLADWLTKRGVEFEFDREFLLEHKRAGDSVIFCGSLKAAQAWLKNWESPRAWAQLEMVSVGSTTLFFARRAEPRPAVRSFGVLFPAIEKRPFLGVLFNSQIFPQRTRYVSETWISQDTGTENKALLAKILAERKDVLGATTSPASSQTSLWPQGLPLYGERLREFLLVDWPAMKHALAERQIHLHGNYLGKLGLSGLLMESERMAIELGKSISESPA